MLDFILGSLALLCVIKAIKSGPVIAFFSAFILGAALYLSILYSEYFATWMQSYLNFLSLTTWQSMFFASFFIIAQIIQSLGKHLFKLLPFIRPKNFLASWVAALIGSCYALFLASFLIIPLTWQSPQAISNASFSQWISFQIQPILVDIKKSDLLLPKSWQESMSHHIEN